jgi:hypothetical protein
MKKIIQWYLLLNEKNLLNEPDEEKPEEKESDQ